MANKIANLEPEIHQQMKIKASQLGISCKKYVTDLISRDLEENEHDTQHNTRTSTQ